MQRRGIPSEHQTPSGPTPAGCSSPGTGQLLPDATLPTPSGTPASLERYDGRRDLVVVLLGAGTPSGETSRFLTELEQSRSAVIIPDRDREIHHIFRPTESEWPPTADEVVSWLVFMNIQCPECCAPEW